MASHVQIDGQGAVLDFTPVLDTNAYADGDVLFITQVLAAAVRADGGRGYLLSLEVLDESDQGQPFDLLFLDSNVSVGTLNAPVSISDADARSLIGRVQVSALDYYDLGGCKFASVDVAPKVLKAAAGVGIENRALWLAGVSRGTGTYAASGLKLKLGLLWD